MKRFAVLFALLLTTAIAFAKEKYVDYPVHAKTETVMAETVRYFTQMGYAQDVEHTKQCNDRPTTETLTFRQTGPAQSGINGISRCVAVSFIDNGPASTMRVEVSDHLRGGLTLPATKHYGADFIRKNYDAAFHAIVKASEGGS